MTDRGRRAGVVTWLLATVATLVIGLSGGASAGAQQSDDGPELTVRSIDGRDPDAVAVEFLWTGDRDDVPDLVVRENGTVVESATPVRLDSEAAFGIVLAIDVSGSMEDDAAFERAVDAARDFVQAKQDDDQLAVVSFGDTVQVHTDLTADEDELLEAIDELGLQSDTRLYDGIRESVNLFEGTDLVPNVIVLTDGADRGSSIDAAAVEGLLDDTNALLFGIAIETDQLDLDALEQVTAASGGSVLTAADPGDLGRLYAEAQERLRQQYVTTFASETARQGPSELSLTIGATSDEASFTPGARLDSAQQVEPVEAPGSGGIDALQGDLFLWLAIGLVLIAVIGVSFAVGTALTSDRAALDRVLQPYSDGFVAPDEAEDRLATSAILQRAVELTGQFAARRGLLQRVEAMLERANLPLRAAEAIFFYLAVVAVLVVLGALLAGNLVVALLVLLVAGLTPPAVVSVMATRRRRQFQSQLPDLLGLIASTLRAGYSLMQGVEAAATEVAEPTRRELQRVVTEARLGMPLEDALANVAMRMNSRDFEWAVMAIGIQREVGGNLAELLDTVGDTMRERERLRRDILSLTAEGRVSALVLGVLPIALGFLIYTIDPDYMEGLFDRTFGIVLVASAGVLMAVGFYWMYKIIDIEV